MSLRTKLIAYLVLLHVVLGAVALIVLRENRVWLLVVEVAFVVSIIAGWRLVRNIFVPLDLIRTGAHLIEERDFTTRFRDVGQPEMDALISIYNRMIDQLREERLKGEEQQQLLSRIIEASPAGIVMCDFEGNIVMMNPAGKTLAPGFDLSEVPMGESRVIPGQGGRLFRVQHGEFFDRGFGRSFYLIEEMTEELRASEKAAYEQLIRMVSHEVNNSVGAVRSLMESSLNYAGQLRDQDRGDFEKALRVAIGRIENLNAFVNGFAEVVRLPEPYLTECRVDELMQDILTLLGPDLENRDIATSFRIEGDIEPIRADKNQLEQVLINVMMNAIESIVSEGSIDVTLSRNGSEQTLTIADSGKGIDPAIAPSLFSPFFSTKRDGRGLGLTLIQEVLKQHRFRYSLDNRPGGGAEFNIRMTNARM